MHNFDKFTNLKPRLQVIKFLSQHPSRNKKKPLVELIKKFSDNKL